MIAFLLFLLFYVIVLLVFMLVVVVPILLWFDIIPKPNFFRPSDKLRVGDIVVPADIHYPFTSGCSVYTHAIIIAVNPIQMVSEKADMLWCTDVKREQLKVVGRAGREQLKLCMTRLGT